MMRVAICCYSSTGNTRLACSYIAARLVGCETRLYDIGQGQAPEWDQCDLVGLACFTDYWGPSWVMREWLDRVPLRPETPAFLFCTCGFTPGRTNPLLADWARARGFRPVAAGSLRTPENYPPQIARDHTAAGAPNDRELRRFERFIAQLNDIVVRLGRGEPVPTARLRAGPIFGWLLRFARTKARDVMGEKLVDQSLCVECGHCAQLCPYRAIRLDPKPVFDEPRCYGCWACYNRCPKRAIYTKKLRGRAHYPGPSDELRRKLGPPTP